MRFSCSSNKLACDFTRLLVRPCPGAHDFANFNCGRRENREFRFWCIVYVLKNMTNISRRGIYPTNSNINCPPQRSSLGRGGGWNFFYFLFLYLSYWPQNVFLKTIAHFNEKKNYFFDGKPKMTKQFGFEISKSPKKKHFLVPQKRFFGSIFPQFQILIEFSIFFQFLTLIPYIFCNLFLCFEKY